MSHIALGYIARDQIAVRRILWIALAMLFWAMSHPTRAADVSNLYEATVEPSSASARDSAFVEAFRAVAVKVSGSRAAADKFVDIPNLRNNVQLRSMRPDGAVTIRFDETWVDRTLTAAGLPLWGRERPAVLVWLSVPDAAGRASWLSAERASPERDAIERGALRRGLPVVWPAMDAADQTTANSLSAARGAAQALLASGERYRADAVLLGIGSRDPGGTVSVRWSFALQGVDAASETQGSLEEGPEHAADRCASLFAVAANARSDVAVNIIGIHDLEAYAAAIRFLEGLTVVRGIAVEEFRADTMRLRVAVRGDLLALRRAVDLKRRGAALVVDALATTAESLHLRYLQ